MTRVVWPLPVRELLDELPDADREIIFEHIRYLRMFPQMYPVRLKGRFRRHRWFLAGNWIVYYRFVDKTIYIRGLWPTRIP